MSSRPASKAASYLAIHPKDVSGRLALYSALVRAGLYRASRRAGYIGPGQFLRRAIQVSAGGFVFELRPESDDLEYVLPRTATPMADWFRPKPGQNVVEVGAHIGVNTLIAARRGARVVAFEANPETVEALRRNLALNHADGVRVVCAAAGSREAVGELRVPLLASGFGSFRSEWVDESRTPANSPIRRLRVQIVRLDDTLDEVAWPTIDWLLIDAEGSEGEVLRGAEWTLARANRVIIEVDARSSHPTSDRVALFLRGAGLTVINKFPQFAFTDYWLAERNPLR